MAQYKPSTSPVDGCDLLRGNLFATGTDSVETVTLCLALLSWKGNKKCFSFCFKRSHKLNDEFKPTLLKHFIKCTRRKLHKYKQKHLYSMFHLNLSLFKGNIFFSRNLNCVTCSWLKEVFVQKSKTLFLNVWDIKYRMAVLTVGWVRRIE